MSNNFYYLQAFYRISVLIRIQKITYPLEIHDFYISYYGICCSKHVVNLLWVLKKYYSRPLKICVFYMAVKNVFHKLNAKSIQHLRHIYYN